MFLIGMKCNKDNENSVELHAFANFFKLVIMVLHTQTQTEVNRQKNAKWRYCALHRGMWMSSDPSCKSNFVLLLPFSQHCCGLSSPLLLVHPMCPSDTNLVNLLDHTMFTY